MGRLISRLAGVCLGWIALVTPAVAQDIVLDSPTKELLLELAPLQDTFATLTAEDLEDGPVIVTFFASWCPPCRWEFAILNKLLEDYGPRAPTVVAINAYEDFWKGDAAPRLARFIHATTPRFPLVESTPQARAAFGDVKRIPTLIVFDRTGQPVLHFVHAEGAPREEMTVSEDALRAVLDPLIAEAG